MKKPRLILLPGEVLLSGTSTWACVSSSHVGWGRTPARAYSQWVRSLFGLHRFGL